MVARIEVAGGLVGSPPAIANHLELSRLAIPILYPAGRVVKTRLDIMPPVHFSGDREAFEELIAGFEYEACCGIVATPSKKSSYDIRLTIGYGKNRNRTSRSYVLHALSDGTSQYIKATPAPGGGLVIELVGAPDGTAAGEVWAALIAYLRELGWLGPEATEPVAAAREKMPERGMKVGTGGRVREFHKLLKEGNSHRQAQKRAHCDPSTYYRHCYSVTGEEPIAPYR